MLAAAFAAVVVAPLRAVAGKSVDSFGLCVDDAQRVVLGIGDVKVAAVEGEALQTKKLRLVVAAIGQPNAAGANRLDGITVKICDDDAVLVRVADEEPPALGVDGQFAGVAQR